MYVSNKQKHKEEICLPLKGASKLVTNDMGKSVLLSAFFASAFMGKFSSQVSMS